MYYKYWIYLNIKEYLFVNQISRVFKNQNIWKLITSTEKENRELNIKSFSSMSDWPPNCCACCWFVCFFQFFLGSHLFKGVNFRGHSCHLRRLPWSTRVRTLRIIWGHSRILKDFFGHLPIIVTVTGGKYVSLLIITSKFSCDAQIML